MKYMIRSNKRKRPACIAALLGIAILIEVTGIQAMAKYQFPEPSQEFYVYDPEHIFLSEEQRQVIIDKNKAYEQTDERPQIVIAFITEGKFNIDTYAPKLGTNWGVGHAGHDNGILITFAYNEGDNNARIDVGYGLEGVLTDIGTRRILEANRKLIKSDDNRVVGEGMFNVYKEVSIIVDEKYGFTPDYESTIENTLNVPLVLTIALTFILIFLIKYFGICDRLRNLIHLITKRE